MTQRKPLKVSGLLQSGKVTVDPSAVSNEQFGAMTEIPKNHAAPLIPVTAIGQQKVSLSLIDDSPYQPRTLYDTTELDNLAHSIAAAGLECPVTLRAKNNGRYELIEGHRRTRSARNLGWAEINANIVIRTDRQAELAAMVSNEARIDLTDYERGKLYQKAVDSGFVKTQTEIAHLFGTTQGHVSKRMAMLKLPNIYIEMLEAKPNMFGVRCAESIMQLLKEYPSETDLIRQGVLRITEDGADQTSVKQWVQQMVKQKNKNNKPTERAVVTDTAGREMFVLKPSENDFNVKIKATEVDMQEIIELVLDVLRSKANKVNE